jgi:lysophospholipase L1-like esterase
MAPGVEQLRITVQSGALELDRFWLYGNGSSASGRPRIAKPGPAGALPLIAAYGDSIADGQVTTGPLHDSLGWLEDLGALRGVRVTNESQGGQTATCWGQYHVDSVVARHPGTVVVAFGVNDLTGYGCATDTLASFEQAMGSILDQLHAGLPGAKVYVSAILPYGSATHGNQIVVWNTATARTAADHGAVFEDPSGVLSRWGDFQSDKLHPNVAGHAKLAEFWNRVLG